MALGVHKYNFYVGQDKFEKGFRIFLSVLLYILDYVNGIGNLSTAAHLSSDNSKINTISRFFSAYSSEGVSTLNLNDEVVFLNLSVSSYSPTTSKKENGRFFRIFNRFHGLLVH